MVTDIFLFLIPTSYGRHGNWHISLFIMHPFRIVDMVPDIFLFLIMYLLLIVDMVPDIFLFLIMYLLLIVDMVTAIFPFSKL